MNETPATTSFDLTGIFGGFVFTEEGKRRLLLQVEEGREYLIKVPRLLRRRLIGKVHRGGRVRVAGTEEVEDGTGLVKRTAARVRPVFAEMREVKAETEEAKEANDARAGRSAELGAAVGVACAVRVCAKKNCWRDGGRELWEALQREVAARGLEGQIELRKVNCLDRCKRAPNVDWGEHEYSRCAVEDAATIVARAAAGGGG